MTRRIDASRCRELWQSVILRAVLDAFLEPSSGSEKVARDEARAWLNTAGRDFRMVCTLAGFDPDFIAEAWRDGRLTKETVKAATKESA